MLNATRYLVRLTDGTVLCTLEVDLGNNHNSADTAAALAAEELKMTDPQRRYLFRLLAQQGVEGKAAEEHLKEHFTVASLADIPRSEASQYIQQLVAQTKEAGNNE